MQLLTAKGIKTLTIMNTPIAGARYRTNEKEVDIMPEIEFFVPGKPQGKARARTVRMPNGFTRSFTPDKTVLYENLIKSRFLEAEAGQDGIFPFEPGTPVEMVLTAYFKPPVSQSLKKQRLMLLGEIQPLKKPDMDNIVKVVADALNGLAYHDDTQICSLTATKVYGRGEGLRILVREYVPTVTVSDASKTISGVNADTIPGQISLEML